MLSGRSVTEREIQETYITNSPAQIATERERPAQLKDE